MIDEMRRGLRHAPGVARGADGAASTGKGHQEVVSALIATRPGETAGQDAALQIAAQLALGVGRAALALPLYQVVQYCGWLAASRASVPLVASPGAILR